MANDEEVIALSFVGFGKVLAFLLLHGVAVLSNSTSFCYLFPLTEMGSSYDSVL